MKTLLAACCTRLLLSTGIGLGLLHILQQPPTAAAATGEIRVVPNRKLDDIAVATRDALGPVIYFNPDVVNAVGPEVADFFFQHERGHIALRHLDGFTLLPSYRQAQERDADCYAAQQLRNQPEVLAAAARFFRSMSPLPYRFHHPPAHERAATIEECGRARKANQRKKTRLTPDLAKLIRQLRRSSESVDRVSLAGEECRIKRSRRTSMRLLRTRVSCSLWYSSLDEASNRFTEVERALAQSSEAAVRTKKEGAEWVIELQERARPGNKSVDAEVVIVKAKRVRKTPFMLSISIRAFTPYEVPPPDPAEIATILHTWFRVAEDEEREDETGGFDRCSANLSDPPRLATCKAQRLTYHQARRLFTAASKAIESLEDWDVKRRSVPPAEELEEDSVRTSAHSMLEHGGIRVHRSLDVTIEGHATEGFIVELDYSFTETTLSHEKP